MINVIYNEDCLKTMDKINGIDVILTSPPYNTSRKGRRDKYSTRYDYFDDAKTEKEYIDFTINLFDKYDKILKPNGCILYNISYSSENPYLIWLVVSSIIQNTNFTTADDIIWKKKSALPNNVSPNKLTRIVEHIFVFCRKKELKTFKTNKKVKSINNKTGQKYYENIFNLIEAANNDGRCDLNRATFSSELCEKLLNIYTQEGNVVYDSFMGTGSTAVACLKLNRKYIGSEIDKRQCDYAEARIHNFKN